MPVLDVELRPRGPYDLARSARSPLDLTRRRQAGGVAIALGGGAVATVRQTGRVLVARVEGDAPEEDVPALRRVLCVDADLRGLAAAHGADPVLGPALARARGLVPLGCATPAHALVRAVASQLVHAKEARRYEAAILRAARCPTVGDGLLVPPDGRAMRALSPAALAASGLHPRRAETLARALRTLDLDALAALPTPALLARLEALPGIGPWTAGGVALHGYGRLDAGLPGDLALLRVLSVRLGREATVDDTRALLARYGPHAGVASHLLIAMHPDAGLPAPPAVLARIAAARRPAP